MSTSPVTPSPLTPLSPGNSPVFTATVLPTGAVLPDGVTPTWSSSDTDNVSITTDSTGLVATVTLSENIPVGESVGLTITATLPDGTVISGSTSFSVSASAPPPPPVATGFSISQTA